MSRWLRAIDKPLRFDASHNGFVECEEDFGHQCTLNLGAAMADQPLRGQEPEVHRSAEELAAFSHDFLEELGSRGKYGHVGRHVPEEELVRREIAARWEKLHQ